MKSSLNLAKTALYNAALAHTLTLLILVLLSIVSIYYEDGNGVMFPLYLSCMILVWLWYLDLENHFKKVISKEKKEQKDEK